MSTVFLEKICRCCLNESEVMTSLFDRVTRIESFAFDEHFTYSDLIYLCTNVRCDLDVVDANEHIVELPRNLCDVCMQELRAVFIFRQKCETSDSLLREQTVGLSSHSAEEIVEFDHTDTNVKCKPSDDCTFLNDKDKYTKEECDFAKQEQPILIAIDEPNSLVKNENDVEIHIVSVTPDDTEHLAFEQQSTDLLNTLNPCKICDEYFGSELDLQAHNRERHQEKKYKCNECSKEFHTQNSFVAHSQIHTDTTDKPKFLCSTCGKFFATRQRLQTHATTHEGEKKHKCGDCDKIFSSESRLQCHRRTHTGERPFRCDRCDAAFAQGNALRCHKRIHTGDKPYECRFCNKRFTQNTILKTHLTLHTGKTIKCPDCDKMFSRASNLILHRREHTGEKPYACSRCPNKYKQKSHLDRHMDTHLGVKHTCNICEKVYSKRWSLKVHMFSHSKDKPHKCPMCDAEFARRDKYKAHLKTMHQLESIDSSNLIITHESYFNDDQNK